MKGFTSRKSEAASSGESGSLRNQKLFTSNIKSLDGLDLNETKDILYEVSGEP